MAYRKPFSKNLYGKYDGVAKDTLINHLLKDGHILVDSTESYDADVVTEKLGEKHYSEAEVKTAWKGDWPTHWAEVRLPERKKRLKDKHKDGVLNFYIFRPDFKQAWRIKDTLLTDDILREAKGRYIVKGEKFFHIPYTEAELITL